MEIKRYKKKSTLDPDSQYAEKCYIFTFKNNYPDCNILRSLIVLVTETLNISVTIFVLI